ncbi:aromatic-L-amino-acid decarboxylase [Saccharopolyspora erythraea NRRL 2338]|nr:aminotransferase class V-fold PLP-dependent enzyme [Saccharopolyspora erythraea]PFG95901.1 aromatic-L-amino-acid decarboxylase [Saccharopolyspora erythraea NRRL 2338]
MVGFPLEPDSRSMREMGESATALLADFLAGLDKAPTVPPDGAAVRVTRPQPAGAAFDEVLGEFRRAAAWATETAGPRHFGFIPGGGLFTSALAEYLARGFNRYTSVAAMAPGLVAVENSVVEWLAAEFGLPASAGGNITTGGSMANLSGLLAARHDRLGDDLAGGTVYLTAQTNHCVPKAMRIMGFPASAIRTVPSTPDLRMDVEAARSMIRADRAAGLRPFCVLATAGTTSTGAVDPIAAVADLAAREDLWLHVDAAYGGFFQLTERGRRGFEGVERADSLVLDPHKGMFLPYGTGMLLVRDPAVLARSHALFDDDVPYLQDLAAGELPDYAELGIERTREFRGLRMWLPLRLHGVSAFREALDEKLDLAAHAHRELSAIPGVVCGPPPELSTVVFSVPAAGNRGNQVLRERINARAEAFFSSTAVGGRYLLRMCVLSVRTHAGHVDDAVRVVREEVQRMGGGTNR